MFLVFLLLKSIILLTIICFFFVASVLKTSHIFISMTKLISSFYEKKKFSLYIQFVIYILLHQNVFTKKIFERCHWRILYLLTIHHPYNWFLSIYFLIFLLLLLIGSVPISKKKKKWNEKPFKELLTNQSQNRQIVLNTIYFFRIFQWFLQFS